MRGKFHKGLLILTIAIIVGVFFQFSLDNRPKSEQEFVFKPSPPPFLNDSNIWADSILNSLSLKDCIGQLIMIPAYPNLGKSDVKRVAGLIKKHKVGGIIFFQGKPEEVVRLAKYYQSLSKVPLMIAIDGEWGPSMRLENTLVYPRQMMLGAINDNDILYQMGRDIGKQLRMLGIHVNFAPVVDINNNPDNPVIGSRSFGENRENVARKGILYMRGMQDEGIIAVAKHFPGHGDTDKDSHHELPLITHDINRLDSIELYPFKALIQSGISGVMMAHLNIPSLDTTPNQPSTLSPTITDSLLKQDLKFQGLVFTDAMTMRGVTDLFEPGESNVMAFLAGNDIILMPDDIKESIDQITKLAKDSVQLAEQVYRRCLKVLQAKEWAVKPAMEENFLTKHELIDSLNSPYFDLTQRKLIEKSLTVVSNKSDILPIRKLENYKIASVSIGTGDENKFQETLSLYTQIDKFSISDDIDSLSLSKLMDSVRNNYNLTIVSLHASSFSTYRQYGISNRLLEIADTISNLSPVILTAFTSPYLLTKLDNLEKNQAIVVAYENDDVTQSLTAQLLFGAISANGHLPVSINSQYSVGTGKPVRSLERLKYTIPLEAGLDQRKFYKIDSIVYDAINKRAMPGCQILAAKDGKVIFQKSYGYHTYHKKNTVDNTDIYDLASLTKVIATVPAIMCLDDEKRIDINKPLSTYLPELDTTNKSKIKINDILCHQAGLTPYIPFNLSFLTPVYPNQKFASSKYSRQYPLRVGKRYYVNKHLEYVDGTFSRKQDSLYTNEVAKGFYMNPTLVDSIYLSIYASELRKKGKYRYSDLGFYLFHRMIERISNRKLDAYVDSLFYKKLGATTLGYKPLEKFDLERITPTENDLVFRKQVVHGYVHDPGAAMLGGVSGHAGLFSNANDLAKMMQLLLNKGNYADTRYIDKKIVEKYTSCVDSRNGNRRGLGFDKPEPDTSKNGPSFEGISLDSYGHTGFTGTMVWADPSTGILYVFLSNRVYPDAVSNKLAEMDVRTNIQKIFYEAILKPRDNK